MVQETISVLKDEAEHHQLLLNYSGPVDTSKYNCKTDNVRVQQILLNLIKNAIKFSEPTSSITIKLSQSRNKY